MRLTGLEDNVRSTTGADCSKLILPGFLGPSSSLSFSSQIRGFLQRHLGDLVTINLVPASEEETYTMASASVRASLPPHSQNDLPRRDYAKYLMETAIFHLGSLYHVFDKELFLARFDAFYEKSQPLTGLWHAQFLLVIAFGKLFLQRGASTLGPPGAGDFLAALRLQTDLLDIWKDTVLHVEVLCLMSIYLWIADMRATAYVVVSRSFRSMLSLTAADWPSYAHCGVDGYESRNTG
jgi:proline utilization trans-activator